MKWRVYREPIVGETRIKSEVEPYEAKGAHEVGITLERQTLFVLAKVFIIINSWDSLK